MLRPNQNDSFQISWLRFLNGFGRISQKDMKLSFHPLFDTPCFLNLLTALCCKGLCRSCNDKLSRSLIFKDFRKMLTAEFGDSETSQIWQEANSHLLGLERKHPDITGDNKMMITH